MYWREAITMTQAAIVMCQVGNGFACRTERESLFKVGIFSNMWLVYAEAVGIAIMAAISYVPFMQRHLQDGPADRARLGDSGRSPPSLSSLPKKRENGSRAVVTTAPQGG